MKISCKVMFTRELCSSELFYSMQWQLLTDILGFFYLTLEVGTNKLSQNIGKELPLHAA